MLDTGECLRLQCRGAATPAKCLAKEGHRRLAGDPPLAGRPLAVPVPEIPRTERPVQWSMSPCVDIEIMHMNT